VQRSRLHLSGTKCVALTAIVAVSWGSGYHVGTPGAPDIICVIEGQFVGIEVKDLRGKQNANQLDFRRLLEAAGGQYIIARSLEDVTKLLR
jgi:hypothetical protein